MPHFIWGIIMVKNSFVSYLGNETQYCRLRFLAKQFFFCSKAQKYNASQFEGDADDSYGPTVALAMACTAPEALRRPPTAVLATARSLPRILCWGCYILSQLDYNETKVVGIKHPPNLNLSGEDKFFQCRSCLKKIWVK